MILEVFANLNDSLILSSGNSENLFLEIGRKKNCFLYSSVCWTIDEKTVFSALSEVSVFETVGTVKRTDLM